MNAKPTSAKRKPRSALKVAPEPAVPAEPARKPAKSRAPSTAKAATAKAAPAKAAPVKAAPKAKLPEAKPEAPRAKRVAKAAPVAAARSPYRIFQIYYEAWHRDLLDPAFEPFDNIGTPSELMEFDIFERLARSSAVSGSDYWGALSWRFTEKTGLTGADLIAIMEKSPDIDVFYCNPHVINEALYHNMWVQGETSHPRFLEVSRALFAATGLPPSEFELMMPARSYSSANYFIARPTFWALYLPFVRKIVTLAEQKLSAEARELLHSQAADDRGLHGGSTYLPFIIERLFPLFMRSAGAALKGQRIALPAKEKELNIHLKLLRDMKDAAIQTKSPWLAACWVNYRALYMSQHHGREWCQKYLRSITPAQIRFP